MTLAEMIVKAIKLINSYSNNGQLINPNSGNYQDYVLRMRDLANDAQMEIARFIKIPTVYSFTQYPAQNLLGKYTSFDIEYYTSGTDKIYAASGAKSYYFEVDKSCTVYIEEEVNGVWTELKKIDVTGIVKFTGYKGNLTLSNDNNTVRIRLTGNYPCLICNRALFPNNYPTDNDVPVYKPYVPYTLPDDYMELGKIYRRVGGQYQALTEGYRLTDKKTIEMDWFLNGQFDVHYFRLPAVIDNTTSDDYEFEVDVQAQYIIPYYVAAIVIMDENQAIGTLLLNQYQNKLANLSSLYTVNTVGEVVDVKGW